MLLVGKRGARKTNPRMEGQRELRAPYARHMRGLLRGYARHMRAFCLPARAKMRAAPVNFFNLPPITESLEAGAGRDKLRRGPALPARPSPCVEQRRRRTRDGCCRQWSPFVNFVHPASVAVARRRLVAVAAVVVPCACCLPTAGAAGIWHTICRSSSVASSR